MYLLVSMFNLLKTFASNRYDCEENQKVKEQLLKDLGAKHGNVAETF